MSPLLLLAFTGAGLALVAKKSKPAVATKVSTMPVALQSEMAQVMKELGVDGNGTVRGPVTALAIQHATDLSARLAGAGYAAAAATIRGFADAGAKAVPSSQPKVNIPGTTPAQMVAIQRTLDLERDPAKLGALLTQLQKLPKSPQRDQVIAALQSMIAQLQAQHAVASAAVDIDQMIKTSPASAPSSSPSGPAQRSTPSAQRTLKLGMGGADVQAWQQVLKTAGYNVAVDGKFGTGTLAATKAWQTAHGLPADGLVGPATKAKAGGPPAPVKAASALTPGAPKLSVVPSAPPAAASSGTRILKLASPNMRGSDVQLWQQVLVSSGYNVKADGVFGPGTAAATKAWQGQHGLPADGVVGPATRAKIGVAPNAPVAIPVIPQPQAAAVPKSSREIAAQSMATHLLAIQKKYGAKGAKGKQDLTLVKRFQTEVGMPADGLPGPGTMLAAAEAGVGTLPKVMFWPKNSTKAVTLVKYKNDLAAVAQKAQSLGLAALASQILASAAAEDGSSGGIS